MAPPAACRLRQDPPKDQVRLDLGAMSRSRVARGRLVRQAQRSGLVKARLRGIEVRGVLLPALTSLSVSVLSP